MNPVVSPFPFYVDTDGSPLDAGFIYYGQPNQNPETSPITVYWDGAETIPAAQPIRTLNGYPVRNGTPAQVFAPIGYSLSVKNRRGALVLYAPGIANSMGAPGNPALVASVTTGADVAVPNAAEYKVQMDAVVLDTAGAYSTLNRRYTPPVAGWYSVSWQVMQNASTPATAEGVYSQLRKNGAEIYRAGQSGGASGFGGTIQQTGGTTLVQVNGSTDYLEIWAYFDSTVNTPYLNMNAKYTYWSAFLVAPT